MNYKKILITLTVLISITVFAAGFYSGIRNLMKTEKGTYATIDLKGQIRSGNLINTVTVNPEEIRELVKKAEKDGVDGYMFNINSPGGTVVTSKRLAEIIDSIEKPVSCVMGEVAASGAYWAATECDRIYADSLTMTGSIGVTSAYLEFTGTMDEYGIEYINLTAGKYKDAGTPFKNITEEEREMLEKQLDTVHEEFKNQVAEERNLTRQQVENVSTGRTFLGRKAEEIGLIDEIGYKEDAEDFLENATGKKLTEKEYSRQEQFNILSMLSTKIGEGIGTSISSRISSEKFSQIEIR